MLVKLPSGAEVDIEPPGLRAVLTRGGSVSQLAATALDPGRPRTVDDAYFVASWVVEHLADDEEAGMFATVCEIFGQPPSRRLAISDPVLAYECDFYLAEKRPRPDSAEEREPSDDHVRFTTPDVGANHG